MKLRLAGRGVKPFIAIPPSSMADDVSLLLLYGRIHRILRYRYDNLSITAGVFS
jgi:hypothetical protein